MKVPRGYRTRPGLRRGPSLRRRPASSSSRTSRSTSRPTWRGASPAGRRGASTRSAIPASCGPRSSRTGCRTGSTKVGEDGDLVLFVEGSVISQCRHFFFWRSQGLLGRDRSSIPYGAIDLSSRVFLAIGERLIRRTPLNVEISGLTEPGLEPLNSWLRD